MGNNTTRDVTDNERLQKWLFPEQCWHEWNTPYGDMVGRDSVCIHCGYVPLPFDGEQWNGRPDYASKLGFHDLLDGLRAKGWRFLMTEYEVGPTADDTALYCLLSRDSDPEDRRYRGDADTLPAALFSASLKAMQADREPTEG